ncbi:hypothetical protein [Nocardioides plantarum]|uniref:Uncharacterized protein n=1 Tax=Nocardioides plantarum TaxID=29299 RepID=A0ABV5KFA6_9ACTN|nr:hypothetical protein [Nocardioides plantarum]
MSDAKTLTLVNYFTSPIDVSVTENDWNCCDLPKRGQVIGNIAPNGTASFEYVRTDGHGCDGRQGQFQLSIESKYLLDLDFDGNANIQISTTPTTFGAFLAPNKDGSSTLVVGANPS